MATYTYDVEDIVWKMIYYLQDNIYEKLQAIEALKKTVPIDLPDINRYYFGDKDFYPDASNTPAIIVKGRSFAPQSTALNNLYKDRSNIEVECYITSDANQCVEYNGHRYDFDEVLDIKIMRYARAIVEVLIENECLGNTIEMIEFNDVLLSNIIRFDDVNLKACRIEMTCQGISNTLK